MSRTGERQDACSPQKEIARPSLRRALVYSACAALVGVFPFLSMAQPPPTAVSSPVDVKPAIEKLSVDKKTVRPGQLIRFTWVPKNVKPGTQMRMYLVYHNGDRDIAIAENLDPRRGEYAWTVPHPREFRFAPYVVIAPYTVHAVLIDPKTKAPISRPAMMGWLNVIFR